VLYWVGVKTLTLNMKKCVGKLGGSRRVFPVWRQVSDVEMG